MHTILLAAHSLVSVGGEVGFLLLKEVISMLHPKTNSARTIKKGAICCTKHSTHWPTTLVCLCVDTCRHA